MEQASPVGRTVSALKSKSMAWRKGTAKSSYWCEEPKGEEPRTWLDDSSAELKRLFVDPSGLHLDTN